MNTEPLVPEQGDPACPVTRCLSMIGGKWKPVILFMVTNGVNRFGAMQRAAPGCTKQMLTKQLREMEADGLLHREIFAEIPPRVEYSLTDKGRSLLPVIGAMRAWGEANA
ncbi:helix-turn-helix domain-containing protein [Hasllibacter sp. MH4015]|uniref:winged helix-turn-helix transcriptional regulator n=1 Tax=Hasllibacter sp. MH4015 TaxID=2854029 RepID=UPI001CD71764|nr:helix-turn-helix domain-containing protein [Hasllibacter sp. MH4015]